MLGYSSAILLSALLVSQIMPQPARAEEPSSEAQAPAKAEPKAETQTGEHFVQPPEPTLYPASRYSGSTPVDLKNGLSFNNGTFGKRNINYEKWSSEPDLVPNVSSLNYSYNEKEELVRNLEESASFVSDAIVNWKATPREGVKEYANQAIATMQPLLDKFQASIHNLSSSSTSDWEKNQSDAKKDLISMRSTYAGLHKNVH